MRLYNNGRLYVKKYNLSVQFLLTSAVTVVQAPVEGARLPFWKGELKGRDKRTGEAFGRMFHALQEAHEDGKLQEALRQLGLDESAVKLSAGYLERQMKAVGSLADDRTILVEHFKDASGNSQLMFHSVFGRRINAPLALLAAHMVREQLHMDAGCVDEEDGFLVYAYGDQKLPEGLLDRLEPEDCIRKLEILLPETSVFNMAFRYNSGRALMMGVKKNGRQPLWMQRLKSAQLMEQVVREKEHPLIRETRRECMQELWDAEGVRQLLADIRTGFVQVREVYVDIPSPMSLPLQWAQEAAVMYDYAPTPGGIHAAVQDALKEEAVKGKELVRPGEQELMQVQDAFLKLPEDEKQLHALLMTQGDLAAGDLEIPVQWLEVLARDGRVVYLEQGLWIAAEQEAEYRLALEQGQIPECEYTSVRNARLHIVRRMLRYRGAADTEQTAQRYGWPAALAGEILSMLCSRKEAVEQDGLYYHAVLYQRARVRTLKKRREEAQTSPAQAYAALLLARMKSGAPAQDCLEHTLRQYAGVSLPAAYWESIVLPARVKNYRESMLDAFLAEGEMYWHMDAKGALCFAFQEDADWEVDLLGPLQEYGLNEQETVVYEALLKRGASFLQSFQRLLDGASAHETLLSLMEKGLVYADSFVPVRQWQELEKSKKMASKRLAAMRVKALRAGRWDVVRPAVKPQACVNQIEHMLEKCFDRWLVLSRETAAACGISWSEALSVLRIWEYTGQARRGYFVEGMSGAQFIRGKDYAAVMRMLGQPEEKPVWVNAADPAQCWGSVLPHKEGRSFLHVPGTAVACYGGLPAAVLERQGKVLRIFEEGLAAVCMSAFVQAYQKGTVFSAYKRIVIKDYPEHMKAVLEQAGFRREMQDYVLYR